MLSFVSFLQYTVNFNNIYQKKIIKNTQYTIITEYGFRNKLMFGEVRVTRSLVLCVCFVNCCLSFFVLSVLLGFTDSDCPFVL